MQRCNFHCNDVELVKHFLDVSGINFKAIKMVIISESFPKNTGDYFDGDTNGSFIKNTGYLFRQNNRTYETHQDFLDHGIYLTTAIKCVKKDYLVSSETLKNCSFNLEKEMALFPNLEVVLLMGDFAIKAVNYIWKRKSNANVIQAGSTYKIRNQEYISNGIRFIPSYTQTGDSFGIEKSKVTMMIEDVGKAISCLSSS